MVSHHVDLMNVECGEYVNFAHHAQISNSCIGARTSVGRYTKIQHAEIGKFCSISWDVTIGAVGHPLQSISTHAFSYRKNFGLCTEDIFLKHEHVVIGNDVWIGCGVIIMPGVHIGSGAVLGAGAVVTHDVAPYEVVAGVPARHVKWRFEPKIRDVLLKVRWWDWSDEKIIKNIELFRPTQDITIDVSILERLIKTAEEG